MPRIKSIVARVDVDVAKKAHNCQGNARHRIERGDHRLNIRIGRSWDRYCIRCAQVIVGRGITRLEALALQLTPERLTPPPAVPPPHVRN